MSFQNFIPRVLEKEILKELEDKLVFAKNCTRKYEGKVREAGDSVTIRLIGDIPLYDAVWNETTASLFEGEGTGISKGDKQESASIKLRVDKIIYYDVLVNDVDKAMADTDLMAQMKESITKGMNTKMDKFIANFAKDAVVHKLNSATTSLNVNNVLDELDKAEIWLSEQNVDGQITVEIPAKLSVLLRKAEILTKTDNNSVYGTRYCGDYGRFTFVESNNCAKDSTSYVIMFRTKEAIAFVVPYTHVEAYRKEKGFSDALKGFVLYGGRIVRPDQICSLTFTVDNASAKTYKTVTA